MARTATGDHMVEGSTNREFARFVVPTIIGMLALSTAGVVDGIFVGSFVGATALASVNLVVPLLSLVFGVLVMLTTGSAVIAGKHLGERRFLRASNVFSKAIITVLGVLMFLSTLMLIFPKNLAVLLGARTDTLAMSADYLGVIAWFFPAFGLAVLFSQFARVDGRPGFSLFGMITISITNIALDALFIAYLDWSVKGAALATGISYVAGAFVLLFHFFSPQAKLGITRPIGSWRVIARAAANGFSEFLNETSAGLVMFLFNWILITQVGASGVAAFTVVNYLLFIGILIFYGVSDGMTPLISTNFGAGRQDRIFAFLMRGIGLNLLIGAAFVLALFLASGNLINLFLDSSEGEAVTLADAMISIIWPVFLFSGASIALAGYFTGMHCARQSALIALSRSLVLPVILIATFWNLFGFLGAFYALPVAEGLTLLLAIVFFRKQNPRTTMRYYQQA